MQNQEFGRDEVAEWLRRWTANPLCSARVGSNPILVDWSFAASEKFVKKIYGVPWVYLKRLCFCWRILVDLHTGVLIFYSERSIDIDRGRVYRFFC